MAPSMDDIVRLCKHRGFVFPSAEIYGGFRSTYDYGPLGVLMLRNGFHHEVGSVADVGQSPHEDRATANCLEDKRAI